MSDSLSRRFARFTATLNYESLPPAVVDKCKCMLLHGLVMSFLGAQTDQGKGTIEVTLQEEAKPDGATILTDGRKAVRYGAAFANSQLMHATNQGDSYNLLIHPGPCIIPAVLAMAELDGNSGREVIAGLAAGYEVECRLSADHGPATMARGFRCSPIYGTFGAAVGAAKLRGLDETGMNSAIGWASTFTSGFINSSHVFHEPMATRNGVMAAVVAGSRFPQTDLSIDGPAGFYNGVTGNNEGRLSYVFAGPRQIDVADVAAGVGERWELLHVATKVPPTPAFNIPVIDLMKDLKRQHQFDAADIESMQLLMNWVEVGYPSPALVTPTPNQSPRAGGTDLIAAYVAITGDFPLSGVRPNPTFGDHPGVQELASRTEVLGVWNRRAYAPRISIRMRNGQIIEGEYTGQEGEWGLDTEIERLAPLRDAIAWPHGGLDDLAEAVRKLDSAADISSVIKLLVP